MPASRIVAGVGYLSQADWTACYPDEVEGWAYYRACEKHPPLGVELAAVEVRDCNGLMAAAPLFCLTYRVDTPFQGSLRKVTDEFADRFPTLLGWRLLGVGSPFTDRCHIALRPALTPNERLLAIRKLFGAVEAHAARVGAAVVAYKDLVSGHDDLIETIRSEGYTRIAGLPIATVRLEATSVDGYLKSLSTATRKDIRRKLRGSGVRVERRADLGDLAPRALELYRATLARSGSRYGVFDELPPDYFKSIAEELGDAARFVLYWIDDELVAFNLLLLGPDRLIDKVFGMAYPIGREYDIYVLSWFENVQYCLETGRKTLETGRTAYPQKVRLGSRLLPTWNLFKHRNPILNRALAFAAPFLALDRWDRDLNQLKAAGRLR